MSPVKTPFPGKAHFERRLFCRRHFQLLEWMVAVFILLICMAPTMRTYISLHHAQLAIARENHRDHLAHLLHAKITEQLYKGEIALDDIVQGRAIVLHDEELTELLRKQGYRFEGKLLVVNSHTPSGATQPDEYLAKMEIRMIDTLHEGSPPSGILYDYSVYIDAGKGKKKGEGQRSEESSKKTTNPPPSSEASSDGEEEEEEEDDEEDL